MARMDYPNDDYAESRSFQVFGAFATPLVFLGFLILCWEVAVSQNGKHLWEFFEMEDVVVASAYLAVFGLAWYLVYLSAFGRWARRQFEVEGHAEKVPEPKPPLKATTGVPHLPR